MRTDLIVTKETGDMLTSFLVALAIEKEVGDAKKVCKWVAHVPPLLERRTRHLIRSVLQSLNPETHKHVLMLTEEEILLAYWCRRGQKGGQIRFLEFIRELNTPLAKVDIVLA